MSAEDLITLISHIDATDTEQAKTATSILNDVVNSGGETSSDEFQNLSPSTEAPNGENGEEEEATSTTTTTTMSPDGGKKQLEKILKVSSKLTATEELSEAMLPKEFEVRLSAATPVAEIMSNKGKYSESWKYVNDDPNSKGSPEQLQGFANLLTYLAERKEEVLDVDGQKGAFFQTISGPNYGADVFKVNAESYKQHHDEDDPDYFTFPKWESPRWNKVIEQWGEVPEVFASKDSVKVPNTLFTGECETKQVSFAGSILDTFPDPGRKNPATMPANRVELDSRVFVLNVVANEQGRDENDPDTFRKFGERCMPDPKLLVRTPIVLDFNVLSSRHNYGNQRNVLSYFDDLDQSKVRTRHCAIWNPNIGTGGAWDTEGVKLVHVGDSAATCHSTKFGTFAIIAEIEDEPWEPEDALWLTITKYVGYSISIILLLAFIVVVFMNKQLWEMFHLLAMNMALALLMGHIFMIVTDADSVRDDRASCCAIGTAMSFFYLAFVIIMAIDIFALFVAIISGNFYTFYAQKCNEVILYRSSFLLD